MSALVLLAAAFALVAVAGAVICRRAVAEVRGLIAAEKKNREHLNRAMNYQQPRSYR